MSDGLTNNFVNEYFLFLMEPTSIEGFLLGVSKPTYSHDLNLLQLAQAALNMNIKIAFASYTISDTKYKVTSAWPIVSIQQITNFESKNPTFTFSANHLAFKNFGRRSDFSKNVLIQAAIHLFEQPKLFYPNGTASFINTFRNTVDFVITQNARMANLLSTAMELMCGFRDDDRILISKLSPWTQPNSDRREDVKKAAREKLGIPDNAIVILNAGGAWKWTQFNEFFEALISVSRKRNDHRLVLLQPSLGQSDNLEHNSYHRETLEICGRLSDKEKNQIWIGKDWHEAANLMPLFLAASDYGLNINLDSLEQWQSFRVRMLEYLGAYLPVIMSRGSFWDDHDKKDAFIFTGHQYQEFIETLDVLIDQHDSNHPSLSRFSLISEINAELSISNQAGRVISELIKHPKRYKQPLFESAILWDYRNSGPNSGFTFSRYFMKMYWAAVNNPALHEILVLFGFRRLIRTLRKIRR